MEDVARSFARGNHMKTFLFRNLQTTAGECPGQNQSKDRSDSAVTDSQWLTVKAGDHLTL